MITVTIEVQFSGADAARGADLIEHLLDEGVLQDAIAEAAEDQGLDVTVEHVTEASQQSNHKALSPEVTP